MVRTSGAASGQKGTSWGRGWAGTGRRWLLATHVALSLFAATLGSASARGEARTSSSCLLRARDGMLSGRLVAAPLHDVMREVSRLTGARVDWLGQPGDEPITLAFDSLPLEGALGRILAHRAHVMASAGAASRAMVTRIWIGSPVEGALAPGATRPSGAATGGAAEELGTEGGWEADGNSDDRAGAKVDALRALDHPDPYVRLEGVRRLTELGDSEQSIETLAEVAVHDTDEQVRAVALLGIEQSQATPVEALLEIARRDASVALRVRAARVLAIAAAAEDPAAEAALVGMATLDRQLRANVGDAVAAIEVLY